MAVIAITGAGAFLIILSALHFLKPELNPSWRMISEYEIGRFGWIMRLAFICLSISCFSLSIILWRHVSWAADILLIIVSIGPLGAAIFATDPITTPRNSMTKASRLHAVFGAIFIFGFPIMVNVIGWHPADPLFAPLKAWLSWMSVAVWVGFLIFMGSTVALGGKSGARGEKVKIGWPNRLMMLIYLLWLIITASVIGA
jgi:hypothetical protein